MHMYTHAHTHCLLFFLWWLPQRGPPRYLFLLGGLVSHIEPTFLLILLPHEVHYSLVVLCIRHPVCPVIPQSQPLCFGYLKTDQSKAKRKFQTLLFLTYRFTHYLHTQSVPLLTDITIHNRTSLYIYYYIRIYSTHVYIVYKMYTKHLYVHSRQRGSRAISPTVLHLTYFVASLPQLFNFILREGCHGDGLHTMRRVQSTPAGNGSAAAL